MKWPSSLWDTSGAVTWSCRASASAKACAVG
ncbi:hypothetical protein COSO111634_38450 [Corallococcus soli]